MELSKEINANSGQLLLAGLFIFVFGIGFPVLGNLYFINYLPSWYLVNEPFHALIESSGAIIAIILSSLLYYLVGTNNKDYFYFASASALLAIGIIDLTHAMYPPGESFVWFHTLATFSGGVIFVLVWRDYKFQSLYQWSFVLVFILIFASILNSEFLPGMVEEGGFSTTAKIMNITGGIGFYLAALFFLLKYINIPKNEFLVFASLCTLFGSAGVLFDFSELWDAAWWGWHLLRSLAYMIALIFIFFLLKQQQTKIITSKQKIELLMDSVGEGIYGIDVNGNCIWANNECARLIGVESPTELIGQNMHDLHHRMRNDGSHNQKEESNIYKAFIDGAKLHHDNEVLWRIDGTSYPAEYRSIPIIKDDKCIGSAFSFTDISERKELENQLQQSKKMEAIGQLVGGIAHDFNNILATILGYTELSKKVVGSTDSKLSRYLNEVHQSSYRARDLVEKMLTYTRGTDDQSAAYKLAPLIKKSVKKITPMLSSNIEIVLNLDVKTPSVFTSLSDVYQLLLNLCDNASVTMEGEGTITIDLNIRTNMKSQCHSCHELFTGDYLQIKVNDTGSGILPEMIIKIFEPYYTTKRLGTEKGSGLGLAVVHGIIHKHNGHVTVDSKLAKGSSFNLFFPVVNE